MESTADNFHSYHLVEQQREVYVLPCPALLQSLFAEQAGLRVLLKVIHELKKCANFFFFGGSSSEDSKISDIYDIFSNVSTFQCFYWTA